MIQLARYVAKLAKVSFAIGVLITVFAATEVNAQVHVPGEVIVKFRSDGPHAVTDSAKKLLRRGLPFRGATADASGSLDTLLSRHKIHSAEPVFIEGEETTVQAKKVFQNRFVEMNRKFPNRAKRRGGEGHLPDLSNYFVLKADSIANVEQICDEFKQDAHVESCSPNYIAQPTFSPNDDKYVNKRFLYWGFDLIRAEEAWDRSRGRNVVVAVIDTKVEVTHPDLAANIWVNPCEDINHNGVADVSDLNGIDDKCSGDPSGNGVIDDIQGTGFCGLSPTPCPTTPDTHGTMVAGIIGAVGNNTIGVVGLAFEAKIMPIQAVGENSGTVAHLSNALLYATLNGADVANNSWEFNPPVASNAPLETAVRTAIESGVVVVLAAGNQNTVINSTPQNMTSPKPIVVAATSATDTLSAGSNYGPLIDIGAPGDSIPGTNIGGTYAVLGGTSMAAPLGSAVAALILSVEPNLTHENIRQRMRDTADSIAETGVNGRRLNAVRPLQVQLLSSPTNLRICIAGAPGC